MRSLRLTVFVSLLFLMTGYQDAFSQGLIVNTPLQKRMEGSGLAIEAMVTEQYATWDDEFKNIYTVNVLKILNKIKGFESSGYIALLTPGGIVGDERQVDYPALNLKKGDIGLFMLEPEKIILDEKRFDFPEYKPGFSRMSFINYDLEKYIAYDDFTKYNTIDDLHEYLRSAGYHVDSYAIKNLMQKNVINRSPAAVNISSISPSSLTAGTKTVLTITGSGFGAVQGDGKVGFRNADNGGASYRYPIDDEYVSWSDTEIKVEVPSGAGTGDIIVTNDDGESDVSADVLQVNYNISNVTYNNKKYRTNLVDADGSGGIKFVFYNDFFNNDDAMASFRHALDTWRCWSSSTQVYFEDGGSSNVDVVADDGVNIVRFDNGDELPAGVLGRMTTRSGGCSIGGGPWKWYVRELDMVFDDNAGGDNYNWNYEPEDNTTDLSEFDFQSVAVHELGHGHQLGHVIDATQIMHYAIANGQEKRYLSQDDLDGGNDVLDFSESVCNKPAMSTYQCSGTQPLRIVEFSSRRTGDANLIGFRLENADFVDKVSLEKSLDGKKFEVIKIFYNESNIVFQQKYKDNIAAEKVYYRLKIEEYDGNISYSKILVVVNRDVAGKIRLRIFPNPFYDKINITGMRKGDIAELIVFGSQGNTVYNYHLEGDNMPKSLDLSHLAPGVYYLRLVSGSEVEVMKIVKEK